MPRTRRRALTFSLAAVTLAAIIGAGYLGGWDPAWAQSNRRLSKNELTAILNAALAQADKEGSLFRVGRKTRMYIAISDRDGALMAVRSMTDAWTGSLHIAIAKARTAALFSSNENALSTRDIGILSQAHFRGGSAADEAGPLWGIWSTNQFPLNGFPAQQRNGLVTFPGGLPLYKNNLLVGGIGVSGDGVDQDEAVAMIGSRAGQAVGASGVAGFEAPLAIRSTAALAILPYTRATPTP